VTEQARLILARVLANKGDTIPEIMRIIELVQQKPLSDAERNAIKEYVR